MAKKKDQLPAAFHGRAMNSTEKDTLKATKDALELFSNKSQVSAWMRLFSKVDTILFGKRVAVVANDALGVSEIGQTDGVQIDLSPQWITANVLRWLRQDPARGKKMVGALKGFNYHELAHMLFSPDRRLSDYAQAFDRLVASLTQRVATGDQRALAEKKMYYRLANLLEDQRIETLFVGLYPGAASYFRASNLYGIFGALDKKDVDPVTGFLFSHGRVFLPRSFRMAHREGAATTLDQNFVDQWMKIVDEYCVTDLLDYVGARRGVDLTEKAMELLRQYDMVPPVNNGDESQPGIDRDSSNKQPKNSDKVTVAVGAAKAAQSEDKQKDSQPPEPKQKPKPEPKSDDDADDEEDEEDGDGSGDGEGEEPDDDEGEDGSGDGDGDEEGEEDDEDGSGAGSDGDADGDGDGSSDDSDADSDADANPGGDISGNGAGYNPNNTDDGEGDDSEPVTASEVFDALMGDGQFENEVNTLIQEFMRETEKGEVEKPKKTRVGRRMQPSSTQQGTANRLYRVLQQMRADAGDEWENKLPYGKLDVLDFVTRSPHELDVFSHHEPGREDEFNIEVVILLDMSPSMEGMTERASLALWQIKLAMQRFGVPVTCYGYNDGEAKCLYSPNDAVLPNVFEDFGSGGGGTDPLDSLQRAYNILSRSKASKKILVTITDGQWNYNTLNASNALVERINGLGATTILIGLLQTNGRGYGYNTPSQFGTLINANDRSTLHFHQIGKEVNDPTQILDIFKEYVMRIGRHATQR